MKENRKRMTAVIAAAALLTTLVLCACRSANATGAAASADALAKMLAQYDLTSEDIQFIGNIFKQYNEGQNLGLDADNYYDMELKLAKLGAALGNGELALWVGEIYQGGHVAGLSETDAVNTAIEWWEKAGELGRPRGWTNIGLLYEHAVIPGGGSNYGNIEYNLNTALEYLKKADEAGDSKAPRYIALAYDSNGDYENALAYFEKAVSLNDVTANYYAGLHYLNGQGAAVDYGKAFDYFTAAATSERVVPGVANAQYNLGYMYENGLGVNADRRMAVEWYAKAADNNFKDAADALARLGQ